MFMKQYCQDFPKKTILSGRLTKLQPLGMDIHRVRLQLQNEAFRVPHKSPRPASPVVVMSGYPATCATRVEKKNCTRRHYRGA